MVEDRVLGLMSDMTMNEGTGSPGPFLGKGGHRVGSGAMSSPFLPGGENKGGSFGGGCGASRYCEAPDVVSTLLYHSTKGKGRRTIPGRPFKREPCRLDQPKCEDGNIVIC